MTARRPALDDRDPAPPTEWRETSQPGIRRLAVQAAAEAVQKAKDRRKKPAETRRQQTTTSEESDR